MGRAHCGANQGKKWPVYYSVQKSITEKNKKRRLAKHVRNHPMDMQNRARAVSLNIQNLSPTKRGFKRIKLAEKRAQVSA